MGIYDTLVDGEIQVQVKCWDADFKTFNPGGKVPSLLPDITIVCPDYSLEGGQIFAIIKGHKFIKLTKDLDEAVPRYVDKWGGLLNTLGDFKNPFEILPDPKTLPS